MLTEASTHSPAEETQPGTAKVLVGQKIPLSPTSYQRLASKYTPGISIIFAGSLHQANGRPALFLHLHSGGYPLMMFYNLDDKLPADVAFEGATFKVLSLSDNGNAIEIQT